jgi:hypothetical protein
MRNFYVNRQSRESRAVIHSQPYVIRRYLDISGKQRNDILAQQGAEIHSRQRAAVMREQRVQPLARYGCGGNGPKITE